MVFNRSYRTKRWEGEEGFNLLCEMLLYFVLAIGFIGVLAYMVYLQYRIQKEAVPGEEIVLKPERGRQPKTRT